MGFGSSDSKGRGQLVRWLASKSPASVFEFGVGTGRFGEAVRKSMPPVMINGNDIFVPTVEYHRTRIGQPYNRVEYGDISETINVLEYHDALLFGDVLEHIPESAAVQALHDATRCAKYIAIRIPIGLYTQTHLYGNPHNAHLWSCFPTFFDQVPEWKCSFILISSLKPHGPSYQDLLYRSEYEEDRAFIGGFGLELK